MIGFLEKIYEKLVLDRPGLTLLLVFALVAFFGAFTPQFRLDASSESLSLENDQALKYYRSIKARYGSDDYLLITYTPHTDLFAQETLTDLQKLRDDLAVLPRVVSVISILDVPLVESPPRTLNELSGHVPTLTDAQTDRALAREELTTSPLYSDLLMSRDGKTTALLAAFEINEKLENLINARDVLLEKALDTPLSEAEEETLAHLQAQYKVENARVQNQQQEDIAAVRAVLVQHTDTAQIYLGGVPMIVADSIDYISRDLKIFGALVLGFLIILLTMIFRKARWVFLPMLVCFCVGVSMIGFLGLVNWPATIVSANFISLLLIFTLSFCVHQIVRYREFQSDNPEADQRTLVRDTVFDIGVPCFYMAFTTAIGFASLIVSDIRPVIDFGWMMTIGIGVSFLIAFTLMPAALMYFKPPPPIDGFDLTRKITGFFADLIERRAKLIFSSFWVLLFLSVVGLSMLYVQNRFIDYYKKHTDIYQGMEVIDRKLGGTTPLDIVIDAPQSFIEFQKEERAFMEEEGMQMGADGAPILEGYWFCDTLLEDVKAIHAYLESLPETGKVLSFYTTAQLLQNIDGDKLLDRFYLGVLYNKLPASVKEILFDPYISEDGNQLRFSVRVFESQEGLNREELLQKIQTHLTTELGLAPEEVNLTGIVVLYNNVLQTLFRSQILTIGVVFITMFVIFMILFRSLKVAAVAIIPNITIVALVLGLMGWLGIPLDIMTITIAAICFGMADDNTIHYIHRFRAEFQKSGDYWASLRKSHDTIGRAMYYTTITIMFGFSILAFSNFVPTVYFGLLTGFSMLVALLADLMLLPLLMVVFKPLGKETPIKTQ